MLPVIVDKAASLRVASSSYQTTNAIANALKSASPEVKTFATPLLKKTYDTLPGVLAEPNTGAILGRGAATVRSHLGAILQQVPGGGDIVKMLPRTTLASHISGKTSDHYAYSGKFTPNPALIGTWAWVIYPQPNNPAEIEPRISAYLKGMKGKDPAKVEKTKDTIQLLEGGKVAMTRFFGGYFWSGNMLVGVNDDQALKMEVRKVDGVEFLIIERGGFNATPDTEDAATAKIPKDWHWGFHVYVRK